jgi:hypothetical protein
LLSVESLKKKQLRLLLEEGDTVDGGFNSQLQVDSLPFTILNEFFPTYTTAERVTILTFLRLNLSVPRLMKGKR